MPTTQNTFTLAPKPRGFHLITGEVFKAVPTIKTITAGTLHLFLQHTSASLCLNENADPAVGQDLEALFSDLCDDKSYYRHTLEGPDDMPAHAKAVMIGPSLTLPVTDGRLNLGTWQGIYLAEHRNSAGSRKIVATLSGV